MAGSSHIVCAQCCNKGILMCLGCDNILYCGEDCRWDGWKKHKKGCRLNYYVSPKDIPLHKLEPIYIKMTDEAGKQKEIEIVQQLVLI